MTSGTELDAAAFTGTLWAALCAAGGTASPGYRHFPAAYDPAWLAGLPLPVGAARPPDLPVALLQDDQNTFDRYTDDAALTHAYARHPRTQVHADIGWNDAGAWYARAARHLDRLTGQLLPIVCSLFTSRAGDESIAAHSDFWYGAHVQISGAKDWDLAGRHVTTTAGDILLIPKNLTHSVSTPADPGHSVHITFVLDRDTPPPPPAADGHRTETAP